MNVSLQEGARRFRVLADEMEKWVALPERDGFSLGVWRVASKGWTYSDRPQCGTAMCAMGFACTLEEFRRLGLQLRPSLGVTGGEHPTLEGREEMDGFWVASEFFGISYLKARTLFSSDSYASSIDPAPVIERLRRQAQRMEDEQ